MKRLLLFFAAFVLCLSAGFAQTPNDSSNVWGRDKEGYKKWSKPRAAVRFALGVQKSMFTEFGVTRHQYYYNDLGFAAKAYYLSVEISPEFNENKKNIFGIKIGYEINGRTFALGIEGKYLADQINSDIVITPKIGLGAFGVINLFYGYNISTKGHPFGRLGNHQFSVNFNLNKHILNRLKST